jgi:hypothetical protein
MCAANSSTIDAEGGKKKFNKRRWSSGLIIIGLLKPCCVANEWRCRVEKKNSRKILDNSKRLCRLRIVMEMLPMLMALWMICMMAARQGVGDDLILLAQNYSLRKC